MNAILDQNREIDVIQTVFIFVSKEIEMHERTWCAFTTTVLDMQKAEVTRKAVASTKSPVKSSCIK